jgi:predicted DNA-binding transcriptional regulator YafY
MSLNSDVLLRQWQTLRLIPRHPCKTTAGHIVESLKGEGYDTTKRTVERDLLALREIFPGIESDERDKPFGWYWAKGMANVDIPALTDSQALALKMVEQHLSAMLPPPYLDQLRPYLTMADQRLKEPGGRKVSHCWTNKIRVLQAGASPVLPPTDTGIQDTVLNALLREQQMRITYLERGSEPLQDRTIHPLGLVQHKAILHLVALVEGEKEPRPFKLHRIHRAYSITAQAICPKDFDIDHYLFPARKKREDDALVKYDGYVTHALAKSLLGRPLSKDQEITYEANDHARVKATVPQCVFFVLTGMKPESGVIDDIDFFHYAIENADPLPPESPLTQ